MGYEFGGVVYGRLRDMQAARRARYAELLKAGMNFTQAAHAVIYTAPGTFATRRGHAATARRPTTASQFGYLPGYVRDDHILPPNYVRGEF